MARYTGPKSKIARKFGEPIFGPDKALERRNYPSGQHGIAHRRRKISEYGAQLKENKKQNIPMVYWKTIPYPYLKKQNVQEELPVKYYLQLLECRLIMSFIV